MPSIALSGPKPWTISFSYGRALQDVALEAWHGQKENLKGGQQAFYHRAKCNSEAAMGRYTDELERETSRLRSEPSHRSDWHDD